MSPWLSFVITAFTIERDNGEPKAGREAIIREAKTKRECPYSRGNG
jgi:hypothetical protein